LQDDLKRRHGVGVAGDLRFSPDLVLVFSSAEFCGLSERGPQRFVGPVIGGRQPTTDPRWKEFSATRPLVVVTLGTASAEITGRFLDESERAMRSLDADVQAVVVRPDDHCVETDLVVRSAPLPQLLEKASVVVCHAGHNTVCESLSFGVPLVVAPIRDDQPIIAQQVVDAGAGLRLRFGRCDSTDIAAAVREVLTAPEYRRNAEKIRQSFRSAGGAVAAVGYLTEVANPDLVRS
jgi:MGT family glycosyltransferase